VGVLTYLSSRGRVDVRAAKTTVEIHTTVEALLAIWEHRLPASRDARVVIKPNLNNDLVALTGNSVDLRVLDALILGLQRRGYRNLTVADGSNVGVERRNIDSFKRLRVRALCARYGVAVVDLNRDEGREVNLEGGARPLVARTILDCDYLISVPKIKTHAEAGLSCAMKNWVGITVGQDKRQMHYDLGRNIFVLNRVVRPDLILVDGVIGMEGNGPGDGDPVGLGIVLMSDSAIVNDRVVCRLMDVPLSAVPYLLHAREAGLFEEGEELELESQVPVLRKLRLAPPRSRLAVLSEDRKLLWLKHAVRPIVAQPKVTEVAYKLKIIQDVYSLEDDSLRLVGRDATTCGDCHRCADACPTLVPLSEIGVEFKDCVQCLYCWWVCPRDALKLEGERGHLRRQVERYKRGIEAL
jgi:uncharacterized protein (DUF362 family)/NAD-dependent dihydropyrimidine dehydrogenase PreA subunit